MSKNIKNNDVGTADINHPFKRDADPTVEISQATALIMESMEPRLLLSSGWTAVVNEVPAAQISAVQLVNASLFSTQIHDVATSDQSASITDADGTVLTVSVAGAGQVNISGDGTGVNLNIRDTNSGSRIILQTDGGDGRVTINGIQSADSLYSFYAPTADLTGAISFSGSVRQFVAGNATAAQFDFQGGGVLSFQAGRLNDVRLESQQGFSLLKVTQWLGATSTLSATTIKSLTSDGDFSADLRLGGNGSTSSYALQNARIGGKISGGNWIINGRVYEIAAAGTAENWKASIDGTLTQFISNAEVSGTLAVQSLQLLKVNSGLRNLQLHVGTTLGSDVALGGTDSAADRYGPGTLNWINIAGDVVDSHILVGVDPRNSRFGDDDDRFFDPAGAPVQKVTIGGELLGTSTLIAPRLPAFVRIGGVMLSASAVQQFQTHLGDLSAPELTAALLEDTGISDQDHLTKNATVHGSSSDNVGITQLLGALDPVDDAATLTELTSLLQTDGSFTLDTAALAGLAGGTLVDGAHVLRLVAVDAAGNRKRVELDFALDTTAPDAPVLTLDTGSDIGISSIDGITSVSTPTLQLSAAADTSLRLDQNGTDLGPVDAGALTLAALADGSYTFTATATDAAGNVSAVSAALQIVIDTTAPSAPLFDLAADSDSDPLGDHTTTADTVTLQGSTTPGSRVSLDGSLLSTTADAGGAFTLAGVALVLGDNLLALTATDVAGNQSSVSRTITRTAPAASDTTAPTLAAALTHDTGVSATDGLTRDATIGGTASDDTALTQLLGALDPAAADAPLTDFSSLLQADGRFTLDAAVLAGLAGGTLTDGAHVLRLVALDAAGNRTQTEVAFTLDTQAPAAPALALDPASDSGASEIDAITRDATPTLQLSTAAGTVLRLLRDGTDLGPVDAGALTLAALADGSYAFTATATDAAGNVSVASSTLQIVIDTSAPGAPVFDLAADSDSDPLGDHTTTADTVTLQGSTTPGSRVSLDGSLLSTTADAGGAFTLAGVALVLGDNLLALTATDVAGNQSSASRTITRTAPGSIDSTAPTLTAALSNDTGVSASDGLTRDAGIRGSATDDTAVTQLLGALDPAGDSAPLTDLSALLQTDGSFTLDAAALATLAGSPLVDGAHLLRLVALDAAGNRTQTEVAFTLDTAAPGLSSIALAASADTGTAGDNITSAARVLLTGVAQAGDRIEVLGQTITALAGAGGAFQLADVALSEGENSLSLQLSDRAGNTATTAFTLTRSGEAGQDVVLDWISQALEAVRRDATDPPIATRWLAMESLAVYDTLAAIDGTPAYLTRHTVTGPVSTEAAIATAAHRVLVRAYPAQQAAFDAALAASLAAVPDGTAKSAGIALGQAVAEDVLALRAGDGSDAFVTYPGSTAMGAWRPTGPMYEVADEPQWGELTPFALASADEFRPAAPPALDSAEYAASVEEIRALGSATSTVRTAEQTRQAQFWADGAGTYTPPGHWLQIAAQLAGAQGNSLAANARLFAQLNVALADAAIAAWDAKYTYGLWRPETAIANADLDGNPATTQEDGWTSLLITPSHPEYVSGHSTFSAAAAGILSATFGADTAFTTTSYALPGITRSYTSFDEAAAEAGRSRVYGGIHYEFTNQVGQQLGHAVADAVLARFALAEDSQAPGISTDALAPVVAGNPTLSGRVLDNLSGIAESRYSLDGASAQALVLDAEGRFVITTAFALDGSADGVHTLSLTAVDAAGNATATVTRSFTLDTRAPALTLTSLDDGDLLDVASRLSGSADPTGSPLTELSYTLDGQARRNLVFDATTGAFDQALAIGELGIGNHTLVLTARDAAGNVTTLSRTLTLDQLAPFTVTSVTPTDGASDVGVTFRPQVYFSRAVNTATLTANSLYATGPDGTKLSTTIVPSLDGSFAWLFFNNPMPGGSTITLHVNGALIRAASDGAFLDADGDGTAKDELTSTFTTVSTTPVLGTKLVGRVVDPGPDLLPMTFDDIRRGPDGVIHTADDVFLNPIAHAKVWILGRESEVIYTDANGYFELNNVPVGDVKLAVDGRTATNAPSGVFFPEMVMDLTLRPGITNTAMGSMGSLAEQQDNANRQELYLPRIATAVLQDVSDTGSTVITLEQEAAPDLTEQQRAALTLTVPAGSAIGENGEVLNSVQIGIATVPPELVRDMLPPGVLEHTFDITIQAPGVATFAEPVQITFPNVFNAAPGTKLNILSFDHTTGRLVINGTGTVSADGLTVVSDPGSGIKAPGWHGMAPSGVFGNLINALQDSALDPDCRSNYTNLLYDTAKTALPVLLTAGLATAASPVILAAGSIALAASTIYDIYTNWDAIKNTFSEGISLINDGIGLLLEPLGYLLTKYVNNSTIQTLRPIQTYQSYTSPNGRPIKLALNPLLLEMELKRIADVNFNSTAGSAAKYVLERAGKVSFVLGSFFGGISIAKDIGDIINCGLNHPDNIQNIFPATFSAATGTQTTLADRFENTYQLLSDAFDDYSTAIGNIITHRLTELSGTTDETLWVFADGKIKAIQPDGTVLTNPVTGQSVAITYSDLLNEDFFDIPDSKDRIYQVYTTSVNLDMALRSFANSMQADLEDLKNELLQATNQSLSGQANIDLDGPMYYQVQTTDDSIIAKGTNWSDLKNILLPPNADLRIQIVDIAGSRFADYWISTPAPGFSIDWSRSFNGAEKAALMPFDAFIDTDGDELPDVAEPIVGTRIDAIDTDHDGINDLTELQEGLDPIKGSAIPIRIISGSELQGTAESITVANRADTKDMMAYIATGDYGLALVDISQFKKPVVLAQLDLTGDNRDIAVDTNRGIAAVAAMGAGLHFVDISNLNAPRLLQTLSLPEAVSAVVIRDGLAYAASGNALVIVDLNTGDLLQTLISGIGSVSDLALDGETLYAVGVSGQIGSYALSGLNLAALDTLQLPASGGRLFVGGGIAYIGAGNGSTGGYVTADVSNPNNLRLLSGVDADGVAGTAIVANGSGLAIGVGYNSTIRGFQALDVFNASDPANTGNFVTRINLPGVPKDVALANGLAFVADGSGGLQILNYAAFDTKRNPPQVSLNIEGIDVDPETPGLQVLEGRSVRIVPTVSDDVQVRSVELLVNGQVISSDVSFPFELFARTPTLAAGGNRMTVQVRATDTGGNMTLTDPVTIDVVADTFPPQVTSVSIDEAASLFFVHSVDVRFDEPLDVNRLDAAGVSLVRAGLDGVFGTEDDVAASVRLDTRGFGQSLSILPEGYLLTGDYELIIPADLIADAAGNSLDEAIVRHFTIKPASDIRAASGSAEVIQAPSANPGQQIGLPVPFDPTTARAQFNVIDANGNPSIRELSATRVNAATGTAYFSVPLDAVTGDITVFSQIGNTRTFFADGTFYLQIVPVITGVDIQSVASGGSTMQVQLTGAGFVEGAGEYRFGSTLVPDTGVNTGPSVNSSTSVTLTVPLSVDAFGAISVTTAGGRSALFTTNLSGIRTTALSGTPADAGKASANPGQAVTLTGTGLSTRTDVLFTYTDQSGNARSVLLNPTAAAADGSEATLVVPTYANGITRLQVLGSASQPILQIVPVVSGFDAQSSNRLQLNGRGFVEGATTYLFAGTSLVDSDTGSSGVNVAAVQFENDAAYLDEPAHGFGTVSVVTAGGTSAPLTLNLLDPAQGPLGDVALAADGSLWAIDSNSPSRLRHIDPASGALLGSINTTISGDVQSSLQVVPAAFTLGSTSIAAGSLLVSAQNQIRAYNPTSGALLTTFTPPANAGYSLRGALHDPASGHLFGLNYNNSSIVEINPTSGALLASFSNPFGLSYAFQQPAGLGLDAASGHLWAVSYYSQEAVELTKTGSIVRRVNLAQQGINSNEASGIAIAADGSLLISSIQGQVYRVDPDYVPAAG